MIDGARAESFREGVTVVLPPVRRRMPKVFAMKGIFVPRANTPRADYSFERVFDDRLHVESVTPIDARANEIKTKKRRRQESKDGFALKERVDRIYQRIHAQNEAKRARAEELRAQYARDNRMYEDLIAREEAQMKKYVTAATSVLTVLGGFGALGIAVLEGPTIITSAIASLEGLVTLAPAVIAETVKGFIALLALGNPMITIPTVVLGVGLTMLLTTAVVTGAKARAQRGEYGY